MTLTLQITQLHVSKVQAIHSTFGKISASVLQLEINAGFKVAQPIINSALKKNPIHLPTNLLGLFELKSISLGYYDNYLYAGVDPVFSGHKTVSLANTENDEEYLQ